MALPPCPTRSTCVSLCSLKPCTINGRIQNLQDIPLMYRIVRSSLTQWEFALDFVVVKTTVLLFFPHDHRGNDESTSKMFLFESGLGNAQCVRAFIRTHAKLVGANNRTILVPREPRVLPGRFGPTGCWPQVSRQPAINRSTRRGRARASRPSILFCYVPFRTVLESPSSEVTALGASPLFR